MKKPRKRIPLIAWLTLFVFLVVTLFPIYWMFNTSFKTDGEIYSKIPVMWPKKISTAAYTKLLTETRFLTQLSNSLIVSLTVMFSSVFFGMLAAYAISRMQFRGRQIISKTIFYAYLIPRTVMYIPLYMMNTKLNLTNTLWSLILSYPTIVLPYATWMMISYFNTIPKELEESAMLDGATRAQIMFRIVFPVAKPGIFSTSIISFTLCWSEYLYSLVNITTEKYKTVPVGLSNLILGDLFSWGMLAAGAVFTTVPIVILYIISNRQIEGGVGDGAIKI